MPAVLLLLLLLYISVRLVAVANVVYALVRAFELYCVARDTMRLGPTCTPRHLHSAFA